MDNFLFIDKVYNYKNSPRKTFFYFYNSRRKMLYLSIYNKITKVFNLDYVYEYQRNRLYYRKNNCWLRTDKIRYFFSVISFENNIYTLPMPKHYYLEPSDSITIVKKLENALVLDLSQVQVADFLTYYTRGICDSEIDCENILFIRNCCNNILKNYYFQASYIDTWIVELNQGFDINNNQVIVQNAGVYNVNFSVKYLLPANVGSILDFSFILLLDNVKIIEIQPSVSVFNTMTLAATTMDNIDKQNVSKLVGINSGQVLEISAINYNVGSEEYSLSMNYVSRF